MKLNISSVSKKERIADTMIIVFQASIRIEVDLVNTQVLSAMIY